MPAPQGHEPYPGCETGGRPKKYTAEFIENEAIEFEKWIQKPNSPWFEDFANQRGYPGEYLSRWAKTNEKFNQAYERAQSMQKGILVKGGLTKKFNYNMCALILGHSHGVVSKSEQKISGDTVNPLAFILKSVDGTSKELVNDK